MSGEEKPVSAQTTDQAGGTENPKPKDTDKLFSSDPLPLDIRKMFDAKIDFSLTKLVLPSVTLADTKGVFALDNGALALKPITTALVGSAVTGNIGVDTRAGPASVSVDIKTPRLDLGELLRDTSVRLKIE